MTRVLARSLHKAVKEVYLPATKTGKTLPILQTVHVIIKGGTIHLHTLELEAWKFHKSTSPARTDNEFETCIPAKPLRDWLAVAAKAKTVLELTFDPNTQIVTLSELHAEGGEPLECRSRAAFKCIDAREYPPVQ